ncbi:Estradiol 17-beta-dehydrogenase 1 [Coccomyxa sp. Obi]|nr:Estradiol 17-beta-dehydrogenase 1 [Coccomyxa sp. Obi]
MAPKVVLITGASGGIGLATAVLLAQQPDRFKVIATARNPSAIEKEASGNNFAVKKLDVTDDALVKEVVESVVKEYGSVDVLINNAGYGTLLSVEKMPLKQHQDLFDTNYFGMVRMIQAVLPHMRAAKRGHIINVTSLVGVTAFPFTDAYSASKFAVEGLSEAMAPTLSKFGIAVSLVEPGPVATNFSARAGAEKEAAGVPREDAYTAIGDAYWVNVRKSFHDIPGIMQTSEDIAEVMKKVVEDPEPHLRYQTSAFVEQQTKKKFVDPTGDEQIKQNLKSFA